MWPMDESHSEQRKCNDFYVSFENKTFVFRCCKTGRYDNCTADFSNVNKMFLHFCQCLNVIAFFLRKRTVLTQISVVFTSIHHKRALTRYHLEHNHTCGVA